MFTIDCGPRRGDPQRRSTGLTLENLEKIIHGDDRTVFGGDTERERERLRAFNERNRKFYRGAR